MIFRKKRPGAAPGSNQPILRGRDDGEGRRIPGSGSADNPLARRFHPEDEPDTIDLEDAGRFHATPDQAEDPPTTQFFDQAAESEEQHDEADHSGRHSVVTQDA